MKAYSNNYSFFSEEYDLDLSCFDTDDKCVLAFFLTYLIWNLAV